MSDDEDNYPEEQERRAPAPKGKKRARDDPASEDDTANAPAHGNGGDGDDDDLLNEDDMRARAEKGRRKKRRLGAGVVGIEEESENDDDLDQMGENVDDEVFRKAEEEGVKIEPFNMKRELDSGVLDMKSGLVNTRRKDSEDEGEDEEWLTEFESKAKDDTFITKYEADMKKAKLRDQQAAKAEAEEKEVDRDALLSELAEMLHWGVRDLSSSTLETVKAAMSRLRPKHEKKGQHTPANEDAEKHWNRMVEISDALVGVGLASLYQMKREELEDKLEEDRENPDAATWEYKWDGRDQVFGPFTRAQMAEWYREGYFGQQETEVVVLVRKAGDDEFVPITMVNFE